MTRIKLSDLHILRDFSGAWRLEATIADDCVKALQAFIDKVRGKFISAELAEWREKRSLDANSYAWVLMTKIADELTASGATTTKDDVYIGMLKRYGQGGVVKIQNKDAENWKRAWKYTEPHENLTQENAQYWRFWVGSSEYDSKEMSVFIDGIIEDAKELGIETLTPAELERMMNQWQKA